MDERNTLRARGRALAIAVAIVVGTGVLALPQTGAAERGSRAGCAQAQPATATAAAVRRSVLCLINAERARRGLRRLSYQRLLRRTAVRHALDMVRRDYFGHRSPGGRTLRDRVVRTAYVRRARRSWRVGENLAWGRGSSASPEAIVRAWLRSPAHRRVMLNPRYREVGIAMVRDAPRAGAAGVTYVAHFGIR